MTSPDAAKHTSCSPSAMNPAAAPNDIGSTTHESRDSIPLPQPVNDPDNKTTTLQMATINLQSINRKTTFVHDIISDNNLSFLTATELWQTTSQDIPLLRAIPRGFNVIDRPRPANTSATGPLKINHGGVAIFYRDRFTGKRLNIGFSPTTFELLVCSFRSASTILTQVVIYRPGSDQVTDKFFRRIHHTPRIGRHFSK